LFKVSKNKETGTTNSSQSPWNKKKTLTGFTLD